MFQTIQTIYFLKAYHLVMTMTATETYKNTNTKTKTHTHTDKDKYKVLPRPNVCYIYQKQGVQGFKILYWLSSCDDKDKDTILCIIRAEYFSGVNIFRGEYLWG